MPKILLVPSARTASAAHTELSTPPDIAMITPRRCNFFATVSTIQFEIRSTSCSQSSSSTSGDNGTWDRALIDGSAQGASCLHFAREVVLQILQTVEVLRDHFVVVHDHAPLL